MNKEPFIQQVWIKINFLFGGLKTKSGNRKGRYGNSAISLQANEAPPSQYQTPKIGKYVLNLLTRIINWGAKR